MSASGVVHFTYMFVVGSQPGSYSTSMVFWTGIAFQAFSVSLSMSVSFLLVDRIAVLKKPISYVQSRKRFVVLTMITITVSGLFVFFSNWYSEFPLSEFTDCPTIACLLVKSTAIFISLPKGIFGLCNVILALMFWHQLVAYQNNFIGSRRNFRQANIIAGIAVTTEDFLNVIPLIIWSILTNLGVDQWNVVGPWALVLYSTDSTITAIVYRMVITKKSYSSSVVSVSRTDFGPTT
ncbi:hypothetical protein M3Y95_01229900 [Aphelenchoides besseyi]|nr:hypothetical protein M3Y95_01229900 [Aphelenchoides besseyi]